MTENPLFGDAPPERITHIIENDWQKFSSVAFVFLGFRERWEAAVREYDLLSQIFFRDGLGEERLLPVLDLLLDRTEGAAAERVARLEFMSTVFGSEMPGLTYARKKSADIAAYMKLSPAEREKIKREREREEYHLWRDAYRAGQLDAKPQPVLPTGRSRHRRKP